MHAMSPYYCHVTKPLDSFPVPASTSTIRVFKSCKACLDNAKAYNLANDITSFMVERDRVRSLDHQSRVKADLFGTELEGYEDYAAACLEANLKKTPVVPKPRLRLGEMEEKPVNHGMFDTILYCLFSNIFLEV